MALVIRLLCCTCRLACAASQRVDTAVSRPAGSTHLASADSLARQQLPADVRAALDKRDHQRLAVLLQQSSGQELAAMRSPLPLYHAMVGSGWAEGVAMLARAGLPVSAADDEIAVRYSLLPLLPPGGQQNEFGSHTALSLAAAMGHTDVVAVLLAAGADANACGPAGRPSLCWAACSDERSAAVTASMLVSAGARLGAADVAAAMRMSTTGSAGCILLQQLAWQHQPGSLRCGSNDLQELASKALRHDNAAIFECFDEQTTEMLDLPDQLERAAGQGKLAVLRHLLARYRPSQSHLCRADGTTALGAAQAAGQCEAVQVLLSAGCLPCLHNLRFAVALRDVAQVEALLAVAQPMEEDLDVDDEALPGHMSYVLGSQLKTSIVHGVLCDFVKVKLDGRMAYGAAHLLVQLLLTQSAHPPLAQQ